MYKNITLILQNLSKYNNNNIALLQYLKFNIIQLKVYLSFIKSVLLLSLNNMKTVSWFYYKFYVKSFFFRFYKFTLYKHATLKDRDKKLAKLHSKKKIKKKLQEYQPKRDLQIPWYFISILNLSVGTVGDFYYNPLKNFKTKKILLNVNNAYLIPYLIKFKMNQTPFIYRFKKIYPHRFFYNHTSYLSIKYNYYKKLKFPYSIYYTHINHITKFDLFSFLFKFSGYFTKNGNKMYALKILKLLNNWCDQIHINFADLIKFFIFNFLPFVGLKSTYIRRRKLIKPVMLSKSKSFFLALKWLAECAIVRKERSFARGLFLELIDVYNNQGLYIKKYNNLLISTYNARSSLSVRRRVFSQYNLFLNKNKRNSLHQFIYNFNVVNNKLNKFRFINLLYKKKYLIRNYYYNAIFNKKVKSNLDLHKKIKSKKKKKFK